LAKPVSFRLVLRMCRVKQISVQLALKVGRIEANAAVCGNTSSRRNCTSRLKLL
jgi:hypothetical protein